MLVTLWGCCLLSFHLLTGSSQAVKIKSLSLNKGELEIEPGMRLLINCHYTTDKTVNPSEVKVEWGVIKGFHGPYTPVIRVLDSIVESLSEPSVYAERAQMFLSLIPKGNCSLIINPTSKNDSGIYQVKMFIEGHLYDKSPSVNVHVKRKEGEQGANHTESTTLQTKHELQGRVKSNNGKVWNETHASPEEEKEEEQQKSITTEGSEGLLDVGPISMADEPEDLPYEEGPGLAAEWPEDLSYKEGLGPVGEQPEDLLYDEGQGPLPEHLLYGEGQSYVGEESGEMLYEEGQDTVSEDLPYEDILSSSPEGFKGVQNKEELSSATKGLEHVSYKGLRNSAARKPEARPKKEKKSSKGERLPDKKQQSSAEERLKDLLDEEGQEPMSEGSEDLPYENILSSSPEDFKHLQHKEEQSLAAKGLEHVSYKGLRNSTVGKPDALPKKEKKSSKVERLPNKKQQSSPEERLKDLLDEGQEPMSEQSEDLPYENILSSPPEEYKELQYKEEQSLATKGLEHVSYKGLRNSAARKPAARPKKEKKSSKVERLPNKKQQSSAEVWPKDLLDEEQESTKAQQNSTTSKQYKISIAKDKPKNMQKEKKKPEASKPSKPFRKDNQDSKAVNNAIDDKGMAQISTKVEKFATSLNMSVLTMVYIALTIVLLMFLCCTIGCGYCIYVKCCKKEP
ncbi:neurofilament heavy polypeptide-like [Ambystoma mexicanum]|uniref:neurofilament heavy polypeptide-like n=1 Tax=Ambystoma mexicanum TaxID=8296 RepID=UPI0037E726A4